LNIKFKEKIINHFSDRKYVRVAVNTGRPTRMLFSYHIKNEMNLNAGDVVFVPFAKRMLQGIIVEGPIDLPGFSGKTRPVEDIIQDIRPIPKFNLEVGKWILNYYLSPAWETFSMMLPPGINQKPKVHVRKVGNNSDALSTELMSIYKSIDNNSVDMTKLKKKFPVKFDSNIEQLIEYGLLKKGYRLPYAIHKTRTQKAVEIKTSTESLMFFLQNNLGSKQTKIAASIRYFNKNKIVDCDEAIKLFTSRIVNKLVSLLIISKNTKDNNFQFHRNKLNNDSIWNLTANSIEKTGKKLLDFFIEESNFIESYIYIKSIYNLYGNNSKLALEYLFKNGLIKFIDIDIKTKNQFQDSITNKKIDTNLLKNQQLAFNKIQESVDKNLGKSFVLYGPRNAGKREICLHLLKDIASSSSKALVVCPEISQINALYDRFKVFFGSEMIAINSDFTKKKFFDTRDDIESNKHNIILSTKFGIFLPITNLKILIINDAADFSYKNNYSAPRYDLREIADYLSKEFNITIVYLTSTFNSEIWLKSYQGYIERINIPGKIKKILQTSGKYRAWHKTVTSNIQISDVVHPKDIVSEEIIEYIEENFQKNIKSIILINRKGFARYLACKCGAKVYCSKCASPMSPLKISTNIKDSGILLCCYQCGHKKTILSSCKFCRSEYIPLRAGTQMVTNILKQKIPNTNVIRLDSDSMFEYGSLDRLSEAIKNADIVVGTQKILKINELKDAKFVCLLLPDHNENEYDYKSKEKLFQLLLETIDFVDSNDSESRVLIQAINPKNTTIQQAVSGQVDNFYSSELQWRSLYEYPPFFQLIKFEFKHINGSYAAEEVNRYYKELDKKIDKNNIKILGPIKAQKDTINNKYRWNIFLKGKDVNFLIKDIIIPVGWQIDINPADIN